MPSTTTSLSLCLAFVGTVTLAGAQEQAAKAPSPIQETQTLATVYQLLKSSLAHPTEPKALVLGAIRGMVYEADPEGGEYFTEDAYATFLRGPNAGIGSAGLEVHRRGLANVVIPVAGGPAQAAGVFAGDVLWKIDGEDLSVLNQRMSTSALSGPVGSKVALTLFRPSEGRVIEIAVVRSQFHIPPPTLTRQRQDYVVLRLHSFQSSTPTQVIDLLGRAWKERPFKGIVLDLRGNPGGLLDASIAVSSVFLPSGALVATSKGPSAESNQVFKASRAPSTPPAAQEVALTVLVDEGTASGAEIVAAALQDNKRARLVGRPTFGRGSIQTLRAIVGGGALKYTSAYWESPSGQMIHGKPLMPDHIVAAGNPDLELQAALDELTKSK